MPANTFGECFRVTTFGESHGPALGAVIDGCPPGLELTTEDIQPELDRRRPGQSALTSPRREDDTIEILSGVFEGQTTGHPIALLVRNKDARPQDYEPLRDVLRPSQADFTYAQKYGVRDHRGSGRASARETVARVAAGAVAKKILRQQGIECLAWVEQVGELKAQIDSSRVTLTQIDENALRCPEPIAAKEMRALIEKAQADGDTLGGIIAAVARGVPAGLGEPVFDKLPALLAHAMLSINACKGFEIGSGFEGAKLRGSQHNDSFTRDAGDRIVPASNHAGGTLGGISSGADIYFRLAFKPVSTIKMPQNTVTTSGEATSIALQGRHDPCVLPRAVPIVEAMTALVLVDLWLRQKSWKSAES